MRTFPALMPTVFGYSNHLRVVSWNLTTGSESLIPTYPRPSQPTPIQPISSYELPLATRSWMFKPLIDAQGQELAGAAVPRLVVTQAVAGAAGRGEDGLPDKGARGLPVTWLACPREKPGCIHACVGSAACGARVWECDLSGGVALAVASAVAASEATTAVALSRSGRYRLAGSGDGTVRVEALGSAYASTGWVGEVETFWESQGVG
jgi:hypothetical protein